MKMSIAWHEECLKNRIVHEERERRAAETALACVNNVLEENIKYSKQIAKAKKCGKDGFDRDKFMKKELGL